MLGYFEISSWLLFSWLESNLFCQTPLDTSPTTIWRQEQTWPATLKRPFEFDLLLAIHYYWLLFLLPVPWSHTRQDVIYDRSYMLFVTPVTFLWLLCYVPIAVPPTVSSQPILCPNAWDSSPFCCFFHVKVLFPASTSFFHVFYTSRRVLQTNATSTTILLLFYYYHLPLPILLLLLSYTKHGGKGELQKEKQTQNKPHKIYYISL